MGQSENNKRIAINTLFLYFRMIFLILIQLYTVPIILNSFGVEDYGIYNVVGGIVTMFTFVGGAMASGSQRFLAFAIGHNDEDELKKVFDSTQTIYIVFAIFIFVISEIVGVWFLNCKMQIPDNRIFAANWVFQLSVLSFIINIVAIPYNSAIIAHERMSVFAYVSIVDGILKLGAALVLSHIKGDLLIWYAIFICFISFIVRVIYQLYCSHFFLECKKISFAFDRQLGRLLLSYSGWNMIGSLSLIARNQGLNLLINVFFGPILNAAHSLAQQVSGVIAQLISNVYLATRPQITKLYAQDCSEDMWKVVFKSSKWTFYLLMIISIPAILEMNNILKFWLHDVPQYTVIITQLLILSIIIETTVNQIVGAFQAQNKIKKYQLLSSTILLLNIPFSYCILKFIYVDAILPYVITCILSVLYMISILYVANSELNMDIKCYINTILMKMIVVMVLSFGIEFFIFDLLPNSTFRIFITCFESFFISVLLIWIIGTDKLERKMVINKIKQLHFLQLIFLVKR